MAPPLLSLDLVYSYDESDIFINGVGDIEDAGESISLEKFEEILGSKLQAADTEITTPAVVNVVAYKLGGVSIFQVTTAAADDWLTYKHSTNRKRLPTGSHFLFKQRCWAYQRNST